MLPTLCLLGALALSLSAPQAGTATAATATHDKAFWQAIVDHDFAPPSPEAAVPLARELSTYVASPDPVLRDDLCYSILVDWMYKKRLIPPDVVRSIAAEWQANLRRDIGSVDTDAVFRRSFSALMLSVVAAMSVEGNPPAFDPSAEEFHALLGSALEYLQAEKDVRGYDPQKGWMHSAAHTADLLKFLARSKHLTVADQHAVLDAIGRKLREAPVVFTHGEDERFGRTILSIVRRSDFDQPAFTGWLKDALPPRTPDSVKDPAYLRARQNVTNLYAKLEVLLSVEDDATLTPPMRTARDGLRATLKRLF
jgi:hypothetical protein